MKSISQRHIYIPMSMAALITIAYIERPSKCLLMDGWIKKMWDTCKHTIEYHSSIKGRHVPMATWGSLQDVMLSEIRQTQKDRYCVISLVYPIKKADSEKEADEASRPGKWGTWGDAHTVTWSGSKRNPYLPELLWLPCSSQQQKVNSYKCWPAMHAAYMASTRLDAWRTFCFQH